MKGGKTTLFLNLIKDSNLNIISDDSPIFDKLGNLYPFPLRIGLEDKSFFDELKTQTNEDYFYTLTRNEYGLKYLINIKAFKNPIHSLPPTNNIYFITGIKTNSNLTKIKRVNKLLFIHILFINLVIGIGLPLIKEYYLENTIKDYFKIIKIALSRSLVAIRVLYRIKTFKIYLSTNHTQNKDLLIQKFNLR
jgi:hypothetical protein